MTRTRTTKTAQKEDEWTVEPVRIADGHEAIVEALLRRIVELESLFAAHQAERSIQ